MNWPTLQDMLATLPPGEEAELWLLLYNATVNDEDTTP